MIFRRRRRNGGAAALAEREAPPAEREAPAPSTAALPELLEEIDALTAKNQESRDVELDRRLLRLRHRAGIRLIENPRPKPEQAVPSGEVPRGDSGLPEAAPREVTPGLMRAGMLGGGCLLVRGLVPEDQAVHLAEEIERTFVARETARAAGSPPPGYYEEIVPDPPWEFVERHWVADSGGVAAVDSPTMVFEMVEIFERTGLRRLISEYLGESPVLSFQKCTLRKAQPTDGGQWHQDGAFLSNARALNVWLSLSHCGDDAPGMDLVPRRIDHIVPTGTDDAIFDWSVSDAVAEEAAGDAGIVRPIFEPGDVLFFDDLFLHKTAADPRMPNPRYAIESWFFGPSAYPPDYTPLSF